MHCQLLIPGLMSNADETRRLVSAEILLAKGRRKTFPPISSEAWLLERFAISPQRDRPVAPYTLLADGGAPDRHFWMRADPVHLTLARDYLSLSDGARIDVSREEAEALVETLNRHFGSDMTLYPVKPARWYARLDRAPDARTTAPSAAGTGTIAEHLPRGPEAMRLHALMNEAQMLLHEHPVNAEREARGVPAVNSIWLWGGGTFAPGKASSLTAVVGNDLLAHGLALSAGLLVHGLPEDAEAMLKNTDPRGVLLIAFDVPPGDGWDTLERDWLAPLLAALRSGEIGMLTLTLPGPDFLLESETTRSDLRHFWRPRKPLARYAA